MIPSRASCRTRTAGTEAGRYSDSCRRHRTSTESLRAGKDASWTPAAGPVLDFAEANNVVIDSGCRAGQCGTCAVAVRSGEFAYLGPISAQPEAGSCLACLAIPKTDLEIEA